jgi:transcriptional regulator with XRE-family HTH domain
MGQCPARRFGGRMKNKGETFGSTIRKLRREARKTLQEMAEAIGVSVAYYSEVELEKRPPFKPDRIALLAQKLNASTNELFALSWQDRKVISFDTDQLNPNEADILQSFARGLTEDQIERIQKVIKDK